MESISDEIPFGRQIYLAFRIDITRSINLYFRGGLLSRPPPEGLPVVLGQPAVLIVFILILLSLIYD